MTITKKQPLKISNDFLFRNFLNDEFFGAGTDCIKVRRGRERWCGLTIYLQLYWGIGYICYMAVKRKTQRPKKAAEVIDVVKPVKLEKKEEEWGEALDPQEEKVLDWILKGVVIFILCWLGLSILLVIGGYFGLWK